MPALPITIKINGAAAVAPDTLGLTFQGLHLQSLEVDTASLGWSRRRASVACPLAYLDKVEIFLGAVRIFVGRALLGAMSAEGGNIEILGPWSHLDEATFQFSGWEWDTAPILGNSFTAYYDDGEEYWNGSAWVPYPPEVVYTWATYAEYLGGSTGFVNLNYAWTTRFWLFAPSGGGYRTISEQLTDIFDYLEHVADPDWLTIGDVTLGSVLAPKLRTIQDLRVSDALRQTLSAKPDAATWWDYSGTGLAALNVGVASEEVAVEMAVGDPAGGLLRHDVAVLHELVPSGVMIRWEGPAFPYEYGTGEVLAVDAYPADAVCYDPRMLIQTVTEDIPYALGIAEDLYNSVAVLRSAGTLRVLDRHFTLGLRPGMVIQVTGDPTLTGVQQWVQSVSWDARTGIATLRVGYPAHLSLEETLDLRGWLRVVFYGPGYLVSQILPPPA